MNSQVASSSASSEQSATQRGTLPDGQGAGLRIGGAGAGGHAAEGADCDVLVGPFGQLRLAEPLDSMADMRTALQLHE